MMNELQKKELEEIKDKELLNELLEKNEDEIINFILETKEKCCENDIDIYLYFKNGKKGTNFNDFYLDRFEKIYSNDRRNDKHITIYTVKEEKVEDIYGDYQEFVDNMCYIYNIEIPEDIEEVQDKINYIKWEHAKEYKEEYKDILDANYSKIRESILEEIKNNIKSL